MISKVVTKLVNWGWCELGT